MTKIIRRTVGIDISKAMLDACILIDENADKSTALYRSFDNTSDGILSLIEWLGDDDIECIVIEATGEYGRALSLECSARDLPITAICPHYTSSFSVASAQLAKTDKLDSLMLAEYAMKMRPAIRDVLGRQEYHLQRLVVRRSQLIKARASEKNRKKATSDDFVLASIERIIAVYEKEIATVEAAFERLIADDPDLLEKRNRLQTIPGVGPVAANGVLVLMPELGRLNRKEIARLAGLAPLNKDSGGKSRPRHIRGGRASVRTALHMAAFSATRYNKTIRKFYQRLRESGKSFKVAITACSRKLLTIMNSVIKNNQDFEYKIC